MSRVIDVVDISQKLIRCASVTPIDDGAQDVLARLLGALDFEARDYSKNGIRNTVFTLELGKNGDAGKVGPHLCFAGHTDVVPVGDVDAWTHDPFGAEIVDDVLYGRGSCDMKTGITCFVAALSEFLESDGAKNAMGKISLLITGDEEAVAEYGTKHVLEKLRVEDSLPSVVLVGEPTNPKAHGDEIKPGRRGSLSGELKVHGVQGHVAYPEKADNPLPKLLKLCAALTDHEFDKGNDYFPATNLEITSIDTGNEADNVVPASAKAKFNVRFNDQWGAQTLEEEIRRLLAETKLSEGEDYSLACKSNAESFLTPEGDWTNLVRDAVEAVTGRKPELSTKGGTSDARFITNYCPVVEYGLINTSAHEVDEHMPLHALHDGVKIYHEILRRYFQ